MGEMRTRKACGALRRGIGALRNAPHAFAFSFALAFALLAALPLPARAQYGAAAAPAAAAAAGEAKWEPRLAEFARADRQRMPPAGGVLFVGSSSIHHWENLERQFEAVPTVIKRGIDGFRLQDCAAYLDRLVIPYKPRVVIIYAGENDLAEGRPPEQVLRSFMAFVNGLRARLPDTRIAFISIKPAPGREKLLDRIRSANALIRNYMIGLRNAGFIDVFTPMLDSQGKPRAELFCEDRVHMNTAGYAIWRAAVAAVIE